MKKILLILLSILMLVSILTFASCEKNDEKNDSKDKGENEASSSIEGEESSSIEGEESSSVEEGEKPDTVEITFDSNGGSPIESQIIEKGSNIEKPADPIKEGYELEGWYIDGEKWSFYGYTTTKDITLAANWVLKNYNVTFEGATHTPITFTMEDEVELDFGTPATESEFFYWCSDKELTTPIFKIPKGTKSDITIYAKTMTKEEINNNPEILIAGSATDNTDVKIAILNFGTSNILAFKGCTSLETVIIKSGTGIHEGAFVGCTSLKNVFIFSDNIKTIGSLAFSGCTSLENITIPSSVASIGEMAFDGCVSLESISLDTNSPYFTLDDGVLYNKNKTKLICYPPKKSGTSFTVPNSVTSIEASAFSECEMLQTITIPNSVASIGAFAFYGCTSLDSITIPSSVATMGEKVFYNCSSLTVINCVVESLPSGWNENWKNNSTATVNWNCEKEN